MARVDGYKDVAQFYDLFDTKNNIPFYCTMAEGRTNIADIGAGTGRISIPLAIEDHTVWAIEPSSDMVNMLTYKIKLHNLGDTIKILQDTATTYDLADQMDLAIMSGTYDHLLTSQERLTALTRINQHLPVGGKLVFDVHFGLMNSTDLTKVNDIEIGDQRFLRYIKREVSGRIITSALKYKVVNSSGEVVEEYTAISETAISSIQETKKFLEQAGFTINQSYSNYQFEPFEEGDGLLVIVASKVDPST